MDKFILELPNYVPKELCDEMIDRFECDPRKYNGPIMLGDQVVVIPEMKKSTELGISTLPEWKDIDDKISEYIKNSVKDYFKWIENEFDHDQPMHTLERIIKNNATFDDGYTIQRQPKGGKYGWHYDGGIGVNLFLVVILYLNTIPFGEGGETQFANGRKIRPECGKIMLCPASWTVPHCGNLVKNTPKYTCVTKIHLKS